MDVCIDNWILGRYWTHEVNEALLRRAHHWPDWRTCMSEYKGVLENAIGEDAVKDFYFEVECTQAFCSMFEAPFYVHAPYNVLYYAAEYFRKHDEPPLFPTELPFDPERDTFPRRPSVDELLINRSEWDQALRGRGWVPSKSDEEKKVEICPHSTLGREKNLELRRGLCHLDVLGLISSTSAPVCKECNAKILCQCIADDLVRHFGSTHAILADYRYKQRIVTEGDTRITGTATHLRRRGHGCIGFKPGLCDLCRVERPTVPHDNRFWTAYSYMYAVRSCLEAEPGIYHALFDGAQEEDERANQAKLADAFVEIILGEPSRELRIALHQEPPDVPPIEAFRPYLNKARNLFRAAYGLPGINEGWVSETQLLLIVKELFPSEQVLDHYRPDWLRRLELDIYLPNRSLAFEYMGIQHYQPIVRFGGEGAFEALVERDRLKEELCARRGVRLVHVRYDEVLTSEAIRARCKGIVD